MADKKQGHLGAELRHEQRERDCAHEAVWAGCRFRSAGRDRNNTNSQAGQASRRRRRRYPARWKVGHPASVSVRHDGKRSSEEHDALESRVLHRAEVEQEEHESS